jgi:hypothetical protein
MKLEKLNKFELGIALIVIGFIIAAMFIGYYFGNKNGQKVCEYYVNFEQNINEEYDCVKRQLGQGEKIDNLSIFNNARDNYGTS